MHLNPAIPGTVLPVIYKKEKTVTLKLSHYFPGYVEVSENFVTTELRFDGEPFLCSLPMKGIWAATSDLGDLAIWEEDAPDPSYIGLLKEATGKAAAPAPRVAPKLAVASEITVERREEKKDGEKKERPNFLKRVK